MSHDPSKVPSFDEALEKCFGGSKHGRTDYMATIWTCADGKAILDGVMRLREQIALAEERLGPLGWKMILEVGELREQVAAAKEWLKVFDEFNDKNNYPLAHNGIDLPRAAMNAREAFRKLVAE